MFTNAKEAATFLESRRARNTYESFVELLDKEHIPYKDLNCIHVTGTNGKGGTIHLISKILQEAGFKVGTFTSPYIICHQDRFCINDIMMSDSDFIDLVNQNKSIIEENNLAMFDADVLLMLQYFTKKDVDIVLVEVGIGGRHDKTNMINPKASIITNVGHDHLSQIGPTLKDVAYEKAGIIKENRPIFISKMDDELVKVIQKEADLKHSKLHIISETTDFPYDLHLKGVYHQINARMAVSVVNELYPHISKETIQKGLLKAAWPGRFEEFNVGNSTVYLDGAHNLEAIVRLLESVQSMNFDTIPTFIYAALKDKDFKEMATIIQKDYPLEVCQFEDSRALSKQQALEIHASNFYASIDEAYETIENSSKTYIICGSLHFISQFRTKIIQNINKL